jgi:hypothetical protein
VVSTQSTTRYGILIFFFFFFLGAYASFLWIPDLAVQANKEGEYHGSKVLESDIST